MLDLLFELSTLGISIIAVWFLKVYAVPLESEYGRTVSRVAKYESNTFSFKERESKNALYLYPRAKNFSLDLFINE